MKNNKIQQYSEEFLTSGSTHLLGFGLGSAFLAASGVAAGPAFLASFAVAGLSFLGHGLARGTKELYEHLSDDGKKLGLSRKNNKLLKEGAQGLIYTALFGLGVFAGLIALGYAAPVALPLALIASAAVACELMLAKVTPFLINKFRSLVGWDNSDN